jgi:hypothetical protein
MGYGGSRRTDQQLPAHAHLILLLDQHGMPRACSEAQLPRNALTDAPCTEMVWELKQQSSPEPIGEGGSISNYDFIHHLHLF